LSQTLNNRAYIGEAVHKGDSYRGEHDAIIDRETWGRVHAILQESPRKRAARRPVSSIRCGRFIPCISEHQFNLQKEMNKGGVQPKSEYQSARQSTQSGLAFNAQRQIEISIHTE